MDGTRYIVICSNTLLLVSDATWTHFHFLLMMLISFWYSWIPWKCKLFAKSQYCLIFLSNCTFEPIKVIFLFPINPLHYFRGAVINTSLLSFFRKKNAFFFAFSWNLGNFTSWNLGNFTYVPLHIFWEYVSHVFISNQWHLMIKTFSKNSQIAFFKENLQGATLKKIEYL